MNQVCWDSQTLSLSLWSYTIERKYLFRTDLHFINSTWKWGTMAPEQHWLQILPDLDWRPIRWPNPSGSIENRHTYTHRHCPLFSRIYPPDNSPFQLILLSKVVFKSLTLPLVRFPTVTGKRLVNEDLHYVGWC